MTFADVSITTGTGYISVSGDYNRDSYEVCWCTCVKRLLFEAG